MAVNSTAGKGGTAGLRGGWAAGDKNWRQNWVLSTDLFHNGDIL